MRGTEATVPAAVLPGMVQMIVRVIPAIVVADPVVSIDVRDIGVTGMIVKVMIIMRLGCAVIGGRSMRGWSVHLVSPTSFRMAPSFRVASAGMLGQHGKCEERGNSEQR
jgi:hypothetical protein